MTARIKLRVMPDSEIRHFISIHHIPSILNIMRKMILVLEIICVLPCVLADQRHASVVVHRREDLIGILVSIRAVLLRLHEIHEDRAEQRGCPGMS